ncbi:MAG: phasin [Xanthobacteraceae bacterium]|nr:phasin [Xanthobacteraceae bacterium]MBX3534821.1 phasin [Xanthobacteraceae bacterium]MBX3548700.1 phasin [Xanthobacteraceae bacterium]MCW5673749.1 phasin [Xanthobacteraceae bacterium]MCW5678550.1 phasin [Xanthobacteraceae bacterium]
MFGKVPGFEIPQEMRAFAEKSVEQAKTAFDNYISQASKAMSAVESQTDAATSGARDVGRQALGFAEENVAAAFAFAEKLVRARDPQEIMQLQSEFAKQTMQKLADQSKVMGEQMQTAAREATKPRS